ncbi:unnamed protein product, partial [Prorocentrum cordatum]
MMLALGLSLMLTDCWEDQGSDKFDLSDRQKLCENSGTFTKSRLIITEMLQGNLYSITPLLTRSIDLLVIFCAYHQLLFGFAVIEVILSVFLNETFKAAALDVERDNSGLADLDEFKKVLDNEQVVKWLSNMGLDVVDIDKVFVMLDADGDGQISCQELVDGASMLKKPSRVVDLAALHKMLEDVHGHVTAKQRSADGTLCAELGAALERGCADACWIAPLTTDEQAHEETRLLLDLVISANAPRQWMHRLPLLGRALDASLGSRHPRAASQVALPCLLLALRAARALPGE